MSANKQSGDKIYLTTKAAPGYWRILLTFWNDKDIRTPQKIRKISIVCIRIAYSGNKLWLRHCVGADMLFPPILLALENEKPFNKICNTYPIRQDIVYVASGNGNRFFTQNRQVQNANNPRSP